MPNKIKLSEQQKIQINITAHETLMEALLQDELKAYGKFTDWSKSLSKVEDNDVLNYSICLYDKLRESEIARLQQMIFDLKIELSL